MSIVIVRYRASIETIKTNNPDAEVNRIMSKYTDDILSIMVDSKIIYTK